MRRPDLVLLTKVLEQDLQDDEREAFEEMREAMREGKRQGLSAKQRAWLERVLDHHCPQYANEWSAGKIPRGKEVPTPDSLRHLPKRPPIRRVPE